MDTDEKKGKEINLLLLGETGVGKSTFINSFVNYVENSSLDNALKQKKLSILIPVKFTIIDRNYKEHTVKEGKDKNEDENIGNSSTQMARSYKFNLEDGTLIRFIDTPGIGDSRGIDQDKQNLDFILSHLSEYNEIHAICFLLKPNVTVLTPFFKFCILELLTHLEKSAANNIVFLFTNGRGTDYKPGDSIALIKSLLNDLENNNKIKIKCDIKGPKRNVFCFDNEGFRYILARKKDIEFEKQAQFKNSWDKATTECWSLINYIRGTNNQPGLKPHNIKGTISINEARKLIMTLSKPLADIADNIEDNLLSMNRHADLLLSEKASLDDLKSNLYVPITNIVEVQLSQPVTVCASQKCLEVYTVFGINKYHYKQRCHNPCYLTNVPKQVIGSPELLQCAAMSGSKCNQCLCDYSTHMHIYYETKTMESKEEDQSVLSRMSNSEDIIKQRDAVISKLLNKSAEYEEEKSTISDFMAKFAYFLQTNSICPINDAYVSYLDYLIDREEKHGQQKDLAVRYKQMKKEHEQLKSIFEKSNVNGQDSFDAQDVLKSVDKLFSLKYSGPMIQKLHSKQAKGLKKEHGQNVEYHHNKLIKPKVQPNKQAYNKQKEEICRLIKTDKLAYAKHKLEQLLKNCNLEENARSDADNQNKPGNKNYNPNFSRSADYRGPPQNFNRQAFQSENYCPNPSDNMPPSQPPYQRNDGYGNQGQYSNRPDFSPGYNPGYNQNQPNHPYGAPPPHNYPNNWAEGPWNYPNQQNYFSGVQNNRPPPTSYGPPPPYDVRAHYKKMNPKKFNKKSTNKTPTEENDYDSDSSYHSVSSRYSRQQ